jgi:hypothetical protein
MSDGMVEFEGVSYGVFGKSIKFQGDFWEEPQFVPVSQCEIEEIPGGEPGRCTVRIKSWLVKKNGWV